MLSISAISSSTDAAIYYQHLAQRDDYYLDGGEPPGRWVGTGASALALSGNVSAEKFTRVLSGADPTTGKSRVRGAGDAHRPGWDLTFSAPKSVSAAWAAADETERAAIAATHDTAVDAALGLLEDEAATARRGRAGESHERAASLIAAVYQHSTSRAQEPQLHSHCVVANMAPRTDGTWGALEGRDLYRWKMAAGAAYRAALAGALAERGYAIEADGDTFAIRGVPRELLKAWSSRSAEIDASGQTSARGREIAALNSRVDKGQIDRSVLFDRWGAEAAVYGFDARQVAELRAQIGQHNAAQDLLVRSDEQILNDLTERTAVFERREVVRAAAVEAQYSGSGLDAARKRAERILADAEVVRLRSSDGKLRYTTREMQRIEAGIRDSALARSTERAHPCPTSAIDAAAGERTLSTEQRVAVDYLARDSGGIAAVVGDAGTGKSYTMGAAKDVWETGGYRVRGAALSGKAAAGLQDGSGISSQTLHSLLDALDRGFDRLNRKDVVVLDEAGMIGSRHMGRIVEHARVAGAKLVLVGDHKQLQPIAAGAAFRHVAEATRAARLADIRRQSAEVDRQIVRDFSTGNAARALNQLAARGDLRAAESLEAARTAMVRAWAAERDPARPGETLMIAATRHDVAALNRAARVELGLSTDQIVRLGDEAAATLAVAENERLLFTRNSRLYGVKNGDVGTLKSHHVRAEGTAVLDINLDRGGSVRLDTAEYAHLQHGYAVTAHKSQGMTVDHAHVLASDSMSDREWSYVAASRARHGTVIHADRYTAADLDRLMSRSRQSKSSLDYAAESS